MKKVLSVILILALVLSTVTVAIATTSEKVGLSSRQVSNDAIGYDSEANGYFVYLILESDLSKVVYTELMPEITRWDGIYIASDKDSVIGRLWDDYDYGKEYDGKGVVDFAYAFNKDGEVYPDSYKEGCSYKEGIDFKNTSVKPRYVDVRSDTPEETWQVHLVVSDRGRIVGTTEVTPKPTEKPKPTKTPAPTATAVPTNTPAPTATAVPTNTPAPTATQKPRITPDPQLTETDCTATPAPTPRPGLNEPDNTATPAPTPGPQIGDTDKVTPRPVVVDTNPTLTPEQDDKLDFEDIPFVPEGGSKNTPRPVLVDTNPTLTPEQESKLDFVDIPVDKPSATDTPKPKSTPVPQVVVADPTKRPMPQPGMSDTNPELTSGGLDF